MLTFTQMLILVMGMVGLTFLETLTVGHFKTLALSFADCIPLNMKD